jgi:hypothetical protein
MYLFYAFVEGVLMRVVDDVRVWRCIVWGLVLCDVGHCWAGVCEMGVERVVRPWTWEAREVGLNAMNVLPLVVRACYLWGIGARKGSL